MQRCNKDSRFLVDDILELLRHPHVVLIRWLQSALIPFVTTQALPGTAGIKPHE